jgi:lipoyl(octanoyl) transferase
VPFFLFGYSRCIGIDVSGRTIPFVLRQCTVTCGEHLVNPVLVARLGRIVYQDAWDLQRRLAEVRRYDRIPDVLLLLEHPATYTLGRRGAHDNILLTPRQLSRRKISVFDVDRGGDVTFHGPGQLVVYPILKLERGRIDYARYIRTVETAMLDAVCDLGVSASLLKGFSGVWVGDEKACAIGVKVDAYGITSHGVALNVNVDLSYFDHIVPCGIADKGVTSLHRILRRHVSMARVERVVVQRLAESFGLAVQPGGRRKLMSLLGIEH